MRYMRVQDDIDSFILEKFVDPRRNIQILLVRQTVISVNNSDTTPKTAHRLRECEADKTTSNNQNMFGNPVQLEGLHMRKGTCLGKTWYAFDSSTRPCADNGILSPQESFPSIRQRNLNYFRPDKTP